jgi:hypothetical protein
VDNPDATRWIGDGVQRRDGAAVAGLRAISPNLSAAFAAENPS